MWHAFVVYCALGGPVDFNNCFVYEYPELLQLEEECFYVLYNFVEFSDENVFIPENHYIYNLGCNNLLGRSQNNTF